MAGMLGFGRNLSNQAQAGFSEVARGERQRNATNDAIDEAADAEKKSMMGTALGIGGSYMLSTMGGAGAAGAGAGAAMASGAGAAAGGAAGAAGAGAAGAGSTAAFAGMGPVGWTVGAGLLLSSLF